MQQQFRLGIKINKTVERKKPMQRRRLQNKIKELRKDLSQLESSKDKEVSNVQHWKKLERKYSTRVKTLLLSQRIVTASEARRYQQRVDSFRQSRMFQNNQRQCYRELNQKGEGCDHDQPDAKCFGETYGVSRQIIIEMQNG